MKRAIVVIAFTLFACGRERAESSYGEGARLMDLEQALAEDECPPAPAQSPIDLPFLAWPRDLPNLTFAYGESGVDVTNTGRSIQYAYAPGSKLVIDGHEWQLVQFHFHAHAEHAIAGHFTPLELHLVHRDAADQLLVVGVRIVRGRANDTLRDARWSDLPEEVGERVVDEDATFDVGELVPRGLTYRYTGSLTAPPCSPNVRWIVFRKPIEASRRQLERFTALYPDNYRSLQPLDGRRVELGL